MKIQYAIYGGGYGSGCRIFSPNRGLSDHVFNYCMKTVPCMKLSQYEDLIWTNVQLMCDLPRMIDKELRDE